MFKKTLLTFSTMLLGLLLYSQNPSDSLNSNSSKKISLNYESKIPTLDNKTFVSTFQRMTLSMPDNHFKLAWDYRPMEHNSFITATFQEPFGIKNTEIYLSNHGTARDNVQFIELANWNSLNLTKHIELNYLLNPGVGFGNALEDLWNIPDFAEFCILQSSINLKNKDDKNILSLQAGVLLLDMIHSKDISTRKYLVAGLTLNNHYLLALGSKNGLLSANVGILENNSFGWFSTVKFDDENRFSSSWSYFALGNTMDNRGGGFFTNKVMQSSQGPVFEQIMSPFMSRYHNSWLDNGDYSGAIFTENKYHLDETIHSITALIGKKDLGILPFSLGLGIKTVFSSNSTKDHVSLKWDSLDMAVSAFSKDLLPQSDYFDLKFEINYVSDFSNKSAGVFSSYLSLIYSNK